MFPGNDFEDNLLPYGGEVPHTAVVVGRLSNLKSLKYGESPVVE